MPAGTVLEEIKLSTEIRSMLKKMLTTQDATTGRYSRRDLMALSAVTGLSVALMYTILLLIGVIYSR